MTIIATLVLLIIYFTVIGLFIEILFTGLTKLPVLWDRKVNEEDKLTGHVSMWMIPVYAILLPFIFVPLYFLAIYIHIPFYIRFIIWAISITSFEALAGWFYDKGLYKITKGKFSIKPWSYSHCKDSLFNGYTRGLFIPLWGLVGLILEFVSFIAIQSVPLHKELIGKFFSLYF